MKRSALLFAGFAVLGLALYLWPAIQAPVVLWVDGELDLLWARTGVGVFRPVPPPPPGGALGHQPKPAYLIFLRVATRVFPRLGESRSVIIVQSLLLWGAVLSTSTWIARRRGIVQGLWLAVLILSFLRLRDASSGVMPETLSVVFMLPLSAAFVVQPRRTPTFGFLGLATAVLLYIRPNCGAAVLTLGVISLALARRGRALLLFFAGFALLVAAFSLTAWPVPPGDPIHGLGYQILEGSADYYWKPSVEPWPRASSPRAMALAEVRQAADNWRHTLSQNTPDSRRELLWRALHGLLGIEYYNASWSEPYRRLTTGTRLLSPFLILAAIALLLVAPWHGEGRIPKTMGLTLLALVLGENLVLGSNPRFGLPFLPALFLLAVCAFGSSAAASRRGTFAVTFLLLLVLAARARHVLDWQWGKIESAGVVIRQPIPARACPAKVPATLHIRIAAPLPTAAQVTLSVEGREIWSTEAAGHRERPEITAALPLWLLEENARRPIELELRSTGNYGASSFLLFPIVPPPWGRAAHRQGAGMLSPTTGVHSGSLDWWAHPGSP